MKYLISVLKFLEEISYLFKGLKTSILFNLNRKIKLMFDILDLHFLSHDYDPWLEFH